MIKLINIFYNTKQTEEYIIPNVGETVIVPLNSLQTVNNCNKFPLVIIKDNKIFALTKELWIVTAQYQCGKKGNQDDTLCAWFRKNGVDVPSACATLSLTTEGDSCNFPITFNISMDKCDYLEFLMCNNIGQIGIVASLQGSQIITTPLCPGIIVNITAISN